MVPFESDTEREVVSNRSGGQANEYEWQGDPKFREIGDRYTANPAGRFPANLLVTEDALGGGSRYFDVDAWAAAHGYTEDGWAEAAAAGLLQVAKPSRAEKNAGCDGLEEKRKPSGGSNNLKQWEEGTRSFEDLDQKSKTLAQMSRNPHPTCKPVTLFAYLIEFLTRPGAVVLDPFLGSGTTLCACAATGRNGIGIELEEDYFPIADARVRHWTNAVNERADAAQLTLTEAMA